MNATYLFCLCACWMLLAPPAALHADQSSADSSGDETLPVLTTGNTPRTCKELWAGFDPRKEPLNVEVLKSWEEDGLSAWVESMVAEFSCSADLLSKLDKSTTAVPLNIAEGTGRFTGTDKAKFFEMAYKATVQSAALVDLATASTSADPSRVEEGRKLLRRIAAMLTSLSKVAAREA